MGSLYPRCCPRSDTHLNHTPRPRGGDWLDDDVAALARNDVGVLVSLLCDDENIELGLECEADACSRSNIELVSLPVPDLGVPRDGAAFIASVHHLAQLIQRGARVAVHCRQSGCRSGLFAVSVVVALGTPLDQALDLVSHARGLRVPETKEQGDWLRRNSPALSRVSDRT